MLCSYLLPHVEANIMASTKFNVMPLSGFKLGSPHPQPTRNKWKIRPLGNGTRILNTLLFLSKIKNVFLLHDQPQAVLGLLYTVLHPSERLGRSKSTLLKIQVEISSLHWSFSCFLCHFSSTGIYYEYTSSFLLHHRYLFHTFQKVRGPATY